MFSPSSFNKCAIFFSNAINANATGNTASAILPLKSLVSVHKWGVDSEELDVGALNYTIGIVELKDGRVVTVMPENLKFIDVD